MAAFVSTIFMHPALVLGTDVLLCGKKVTPNLLCLLELLALEWYRGRNSTTAEEVSRFQSLFPYPN